MALTDLDLAASSSGYAFTEPTTNELVRMKNRFLVQFLSRTANGRGSFFIDQLLDGRIKTNSDVVQIFSLTAAAIMTDLRNLSEEIYPTQISLESFEFVAPRRVKLLTVIRCREGTVIASIVVSETT